MLFFIVLLTGSGSDSDDGCIDYALFIGLQFVGIIEEKKISIDGASVVDSQCREYASSIRPEDQSMCVGQWGELCVPFFFAAYGRKYVEQWKEKSGVWFRDVRNSQNKSRALQGWMSPERIMALLNSSQATANGVGGLTVQADRCRNSLTCRHIQRCAAMYARFPDGSSVPACHPDVHATFVQKHKPPMFNRQF